MNRPRNLLFIMTDQQRADTLACYGNDWVQAPTLNALAEKSCVFENAYCTQPVCTPSRGSIMSGLFPHAHGAIHNRTGLPASIKTLPDYLPEVYRSAYIGKWHLGDELIPQHNIDEWISSCDHPWYVTKAENQLLHSDYHRYLLSRGYVPDWKPASSKSAKVRFNKSWSHRLPPHETPAEFVADQAADFLGRVGDEPFVAYVSIHEPHNPFTSRLDDLYDPAALPVGPHFLEPPTNVSARTQTMADRWDASSGYRGFLGQAGDELKTEAGWRRVRARYYGMVTLVDQALAPVMEALEASGQADNTIIVFTSDHGDMMGDHHLLTKGVMYEESVRVPLLIHIPGLEPKRIPGRVSQIDLVPTLLDLLELPAIPTLHGKSLRPVLDGTATLADNDVIIEWETPDAPATYDLPGRWRTIISHEGWKLNVCRDDTAEFYDLNQDPHESTNCIDQPDQQARIQLLLQRLHAWQSKTADALDLPLSPSRIS